jgi:hypothetical protein
MVCLAGDTSSASTPNWRWYRAMPAAILAGHDGPVPVSDRQRPGFGPFRRFGLLCEVEVFGCASLRIGTGVGDFSPVDFAKSGVVAVGLGLSQDCSVQRRVERFAAQTGTQSLCRHRFNHRSAVRLLSAA